MDCFSFTVPELDKPYTRRGVLLVLNSLYDPLGFVAPVTIVEMERLDRFTEMSSTVFSAKNNLRVFLPIIVVTPSVSQAT